MKVYAASDLLLILAAAASKGTTFPAARVSAQRTLQLQASSELNVERIGGHFLHQTSCLWSI
jgi:hypothetical protein